MQPTGVFPILREIGPNIYPLYRDKTQAKMQALGLDTQQPQWYILAVAKDFEPEPATIAKFIERGPYNNPAVHKERLDAVVEKGWMTVNNAGEYTVTAEGQRLFDAVSAEFDSALDAITPIDAGDVQRIIALLGKIVEAALNAAEPAEKPYITYNRNSDPGPDGPPMLRILQYNADLNSFRDDCHVAAWKAKTANGHGFEMLSMIWAGDAETVEKVLELRAGRGYVAADYKAAMDEFIALGWITAAGDTYALTDAGKAMREDIEALTDRLYYVPWTALSETEIDELGALLTTLRDALKALVAAREAEPTGA
ncbi:MAG: hypothetical protein K8S97_07485 [Anaerolineae bacterium]|nr:hypothetical protein [Anaerolineae bacterium]